MEKFRIYQKWNHREKLQDGRVVGHVLIFSCENSKIATNHWTIIDRRMFSSVQFSHSVVSDFVTPWTTTRQASLSITYSRSLFKLMSIESVMSSYYLVLCCPLLLLPSIFPSIWVFSSEVAKVLEFFASGGQSIRVSASASVLSMNIQDWFPLGWTGWLSLQSRDSQESSPTPQFKSIHSSVLSFLYSPTHNYTWLLEKP